MATDKALMRQQLISFIGHRIVVVLDAPPPFLAQRPTVKIGLRGPDGGESWFDDAQSFGTALADDVGFRAIELGTWLNSPDGVLISEAVAEVLSPAYRPEYQMVVDGLKYAADHQRQAGWQTAVGAIVVVAALAVGIFVLRGE